MASGSRVETPALSQPPAPASLLWPSLIFSASPWPHTNLNAVLWMCRNLSLWSWDTNARIVGLISWGTSHDFKTPSLKVNPSVFEIYHGNKNWQRARFIPHLFAKRTRFITWFWQMVVHLALGMRHTCFKVMAAHGNVLRFASDLCAGGPLAHLAQVWSRRRGKLLWAFLERFSSHQKKPHKEDKTPLLALDAAVLNIRIWYLGQYNHELMNPRTKVSVLRRVQWHSCKFYFP